MIFFLYGIIHLNSHHKTPNSTDYIIMIFMGTLFNFGQVIIPNIYYCKIISSVMVAIGSGSKNNHYASPFMYTATKHISAC